MASSCSAEIRLDGKEFIEDLERERLARLRDEFAKAAMQGMLASGMFSEEFTEQEFPDQESADRREMARALIAEYAYTQADAMLVKRELP